MERTMHCFLCQLYSLIRSGHLILKKGVFLFDHDLCVGTLGIYNIFMVINRTSVLYYLYSCVSKCLENYF